MQTQKRRPFGNAQGKQECLRHWSLGTGHRPLLLPPVGYITAVLRGYCVGAYRDGTYQNTGKVREPALRVCRFCA